MPSPPKRKKKDGVPTRKVAPKNFIPTITVYSFMEPLTFEAYIFEQSPGNDGYTASFKKVMKGDLECGYLTDKNFTKFVYRRDLHPHRSNEILCNARDEKHWRCLMIRYPGLDGSTEESRQEGLAVAKRFFMDPEYSEYPPKNIETVDAMKEDPEKFPALDEFFLDHDINAFLREDVESTELNEDFVENYPDFAAKCWSTMEPSKWARSLGF